MVQAPRMGSPGPKLTWTRVFLYATLSGAACAGIFWLALVVFERYLPDNDFMALMMGVNGIFLAALLFLASFGMVLYFLGIQVHLRKIGKY